jgi:ATP-dependent Clp protease ATP-binding subunit ClpA
MKMLQGERENYYIEQELHHRVVGKRKAIEAVSDAVRRIALDCRT